MSVAFASVIGSPSPVRIVKFVSLHRDWESLILKPRQNSTHPLLQPHPVELVPSEHVGQNHFVSDLQSLQNLDPVHRTPPPLNIDSHDFRSVFTNLLTSDP